jgi:signal transduction histidine kinase
VRGMRHERTDDLLRIAGLVVWLVVGGPSWTRLASDPASVGSGHPVIWVALYLLFATAFVLATSPRPAIARRRQLLLAESTLALALAWLGMPHFEGALFAIVAAQTPQVMAPLAACLWAVAQGVVLAPIVLPSHGPVGTAKAVGEYLAFSMFALLVLVLRERERAARLDLARVNATLLATQALLAEQTRHAERLRVAREVHDAIGHGLTAASLHLQLAARSSDPKEPVRAAQEAVTTTLAEVRDLVRVMRGDRAFDAASAIRSLCEGVREPRIHLEVAPALRIRDAERALTIFRCVQEALTNAMRHARARNVWIAVSESEVAVRDDGVGALPLQLGNGLRGLRERVTGAGGTLDVGSAGGTGLSIRVKFVA